jgi:hypothetical protein
MQRLTTDHRSSVPDLLYVYAVPVNLPYIPELYPTSYIRNLHTLSTPHILYQFSTYPLSYILLYPLSQPHIQTNRRALPNNNCVFGLRIFNSTQKVQWM